MKQMITIELKRALLSGKMCCALALGVAISLWHFIQEVCPVLQAQTDFISLEDATMGPISVFYVWIGGNSHNVQQYIFYLLFPIIAMLPFAMSYFEDKKCGVLKNIVIRSDKKQYLGAKYIAVFISAGIAIVIPLLVNLLLTAAIVPSISPNIATFRYAIDGGSMWWRVFYTHPYVYLVLYLGINFLFAGCIAGTALIVATFTEHKFIVAISPFVVYIFLYAFFSVIEKENWEPLYFLNPSYSYSNIAIILTEMAILMIATLISYFRGEQKNEIM